MSAPEEVLERRPRNARRRPAPGWVVLGCVILALAGLIAARQAGRHAGSGARAPNAVASSMAPAALVPSSAVYIAKDAPTVELDRKLFVVAGGLLLTVSLDSPLVTTSELPVPTAAYVLLADSGRHRLWLVQRDSLRADVYSSDGVAQGSVSPGGAADGVALLDGELYVATSSGVRRISFDGAVLRDRPTSVPRGELIAADASRHRLLFVDHPAGVQPSVRAQRPGRRTADGAGGLPLNTTELVIAGANLWVTGFQADNSTVLERLDPATLRVVRHSVLERRLAGVAVVGADRRVLLVRDITGGDGLWCVDAQTGAVRASWSSVPGAVALGPDGGYAITSADHRPRLLTGGRCRG